ncbi:MAG TPA: MFS transporter [Solirubrobacteraceae bacterium]|nr:MFS transporter [Solirubrobacteraceae bacterium]
MMRRLLAVRDARVFLAGQAVSAFGDSALWLATGIWVKSLTGSSAAAGLSFFFFSAPALLAPASGLVVDRVSRRRLLVAINASTGCAVLALLLVHGAGQVWLIYVVMVIYGLAHSTIGAAQSALLASMLPPGLLANANGALRTLQGTLGLVAPLTGAGLFALIGPHPLVLLDAATFAVPVLCALSLRVAEAPVRPRAGRWRTELSAGVRHLVANPPLRQVTVAAVCAVLGFGFSETTIFAVVDQGLHRAPAFVGVLVTLQGAGAVLGGLTAAPLVRRIGERRLIATGLLVMGVASLVEIPPFFGSVLPGFVLFGLSLPWVIVGLTTLVQRLTPSELQGRVYAAADAVITTPQTISVAAGAALIGVAGYQVLLGTMAGCNALAGSYLARRYRCPGEQPHQPRQHQRPRPAGVG